jgi:hypothetical protein
MKTHFLIYSLFTGIIVISFSCQQVQEKAVITEDDWFVWSPDYDFENSHIIMPDWLDAPAGKHGEITMLNGDLLFEDGTPIKFWGTNICSGKPYVDNTTADAWVEYLARYGMNGVRFHKFTSHALKGNTSTELDPEMFDRMDYFHSRLKKAGIYYGWSHIYGHKPRPGDKDKLLAYEEVAGIEVPWSHLNGATSGLVNFAHDLQDLNIELTVNMLNHTNPYTGISYGRDPALVFIELQNEDNIYWGAIMESLKQTPTYKALLSKQFSAWLREKYRTQQDLEIAWGKENIPEGESLEKMNIFPNPNHHTFSAEYRKAIEEGRKMDTHYLDKAYFLYEKQNEFYDRFIRAIRSTGYRGLIVGSCWQAGSGLTHFYNIHNDFRAGMIDRHNYFGGGTGHRLTPGKVRNASMTSNPGSGLLGVGTQQVINRPFSFSEWMSLQPNEWTAEAAPLIAIYGLGLQGWDASYSFASNDSKFSNAVQANSHGVYNVESPLHVSIYPNLARMIYRGDITQGETVAVKKVHIPSLAEEGKLGFEESVEQNYDFKEFKGTIPQQALAIGQVVIEFTSDFEETQSPDIKEYWDEVNKVIHSTTGELAWNFGENKYVSVNSSGTQGFVGFCHGVSHDLNDLKIISDNEFAIVLATSLEKDKSISEAKKILITALARVHNTNMQYNEDKSELVEVGEPPVRMEPVVARIEFKGKSGFKVHVLDHVGKKTGNELRVKGGKVLLDGRENKTIYYLIEF